MKQIRQEIISGLCLALRIFVYLILFPITITGQYKTNHIWQAKKK
jgi:hypothetical protein